MQNMTRFIKDHTVSSCILAVLSISSKEYLREIRVSRCKKDTILKEYKRVKITCIAGSNGKTSTRYLFKDSTELSNKEFVSLYPLQSNRFKKIFAEEYNNLVETK